MENLTEKQKEFLRKLKITLCDAALHYSEKTLYELFPEAFEKWERESIIVKIDWEKQHHIDITAVDIKGCLTKRDLYGCLSLEVTELPEVYTPEDMIEFAEYWQSGDDSIYKVDEVFKEWKQDRNK